LTKVEETRERKREVDGWILTLDDVRGGGLSGMNSRGEEDDLLLVVATEIRRVSDGQQVDSPLLLRSTTASPHYAFVWPFSVVVSIYAVALH